MTKSFEKLIKQYEEHCRKIEQSATININETPKEKIKRMRGLERDYVDWFEYYFQMYAKSKCAWFHKRMANKIIENPECNLLGEIYRSGAKSVHLDMGIPLYLYLVKKDLFFLLLIGETVDKAKKLISDIQAQLQHNSRLINDYGKRFKYGDWAEGDFSTVDGVRFVSRGFRQSVRGLREGAQRPDYIVVDDVDTKKLCNNEKLSRRAYEWVWEDLRGTFDEGAKRKRFVVANNNFHKNTIINQLKGEFNRINERAKETGRKIKHFVISVAAVKSLVTFEPNWPEKTSAEYWKEKYDSTPYRSFMREYMHKHIQDGTIFKPEHIQYKKRLRFDQYDALCFYGDLSYKDAGDYKGMGLVGRIGKEYHLIFCFLRQSTRKAVAEWVYDLYEKHNLGKYNIKYLIEGLFAMDEFVNDFDLVGEERGFYIPVVADKKSKINKYDRIESMAGFFERLNVYFNEEFKGNNDFATMEDQLYAFEKGSTANDDGPDFLQSGMAEVNKASFVAKFKPRTKSRKEIQANKKNRF
ncbi:hypothetical protein [Faecalibacter bovis]|uniref:Terminase large subunit gp17-like C-terminal domain-containing protein n=1 Tax=Faecalibacter bovis TaxID=2898187 RepID=A0ABX7XDS9_9FLAO|nr:hypothetical protein [Faecalibacter bovis]QTV06048.1 hypothetical protein J9309_01485 [Faecalibacter bovis]